MINRWKISSDNSRCDFPVANAKSLSDVDEEDADIPMIPMAQITAPVITAPVITAPAHEMSRRRPYSQERCNELRRAYCITRRRPISNQTHIDFSAVQEEWYRYS